MSLSIRLTFARWFGVALVGTATFLLLTSPLIAQPSPEVTPETTEYALPPITPTFTPTSTTTPAPPVATTAPLTTPDAEGTAEATAEVIVEVPSTLTQEATAVSTDEATAEATAENTAAPADPIEPSITPEITVEVTAEAPLEVTTEATAEATAESTDAVLPPAAAAVETVLIAGRASYQNRAGGSAGIEIRVYTIDRVLVSSTQTDQNGGYIVAVPAHEFYWLTADAPLHRTFVRGIYPTETVPPIMLAGGDLNADACINRVDIELLQSDIQTQALHADINGDGLTDARDLAILTGNFDAACQPTGMLSSAPEKTAEPMAEVTAEATPEVSPEALPQSSTAP